MTLEKGQQIFKEDLEALLVEVNVGYFNDFDNQDKYATPKMELAKKLEELRQNIINGKYDATT